LIEPSQSDGISGVENRSRQPHPRSFHRLSGLES
jgi:hypothetical protein